MNITINNEKIDNCVKFKYKTFCLIECTKQLLTLSKSFKKHRVNSHFLSVARKLVARDTEGILQAHFFLLLEKKSSNLNLLGLASLYAVPPFSEFLIGPDYRLLYGEGKEEHSLGWLKYKC